MKRVWIARRLAQAWAEGKTDAELHLDLYQHWKNRLAEHGVPSLAGLRVLDIGCGDRAPTSLLAAADGAIVSALDLMPVALGRNRPRMWWAIGRDLGPKAAAKTLIRDAVHTWRYWRTLARLTGRGLPFASVSIVRGDAGRLPFGDRTFDVIFSSAVWEHLADVDAATEEVGRVLKSDGRAVIQIALFPGIQGGHHWEWHKVDPETRRSVRPWDHLRANPLPHPVFLNGLRESEYRAVFDRRLQIVEWEDGELRGQRYLTQPLELELREYTRRDLLLSWVTVFAKRSWSSIEANRRASI